MKIGINTIIAEAVETIDPQHHDDKPLIRQFINDSLDAYSRSGHQVTFDYNQPRAVKLVQKGLRANWGIKSA